MSVVIPVLSEDPIDIVVEDSAVGVAPHLTIGTVETLQPDTPAYATITGTNMEPVLNMGIPQGEKGDDGTSAYMWIKYSANQPTADSDMTDTPSAWIGVYSGTSETAPIHYTDYSWYQFKGETGRAGANPFAFTVTLASASWNAGVQTVSNANFLTGDYCYMVYASPSSTYAWQDADVYADDVTTAGQMVFHCDVTPSSDLVANVIRLVVDT